MLLHHITPSRSPHNALHSPSIHLSSWRVEGESGDETINCDAMMVYCQAQQSRARLGNRDVVPVAALQSRPRECQMYVTVLVPGSPPASLSHVILLGVSKYVSDRVRYF